MRIIAGTAIWAGALIVLLTGGPGGDASSTSAGPVQRQIVEVAKEP